MRNSHRNNLELVYLLVIIVLFIIMLLTIPLDAQAPTLKKCDHDSTDMARFRGEGRDGYFPFVARNYDGSKIEWTLMDNHGINNGTLTVDAQTKLPMGFTQNYKGRLFWALYSACDEYAYEIAEMSEQQVKEFRKTNPK